MVDILSAADVLRAEKLGFLTQDEQDELRLWGENKTNPAPGITPDNLPLSALCLSGGGIRSAAFCLGVIQVFAARGMLAQFHYLSTVSGGGYIGGWLTRCIAAWNGDVAKVESQLNVYERETASGDLDRADHREPPELRQLRRFTNFLTPNPGFASVDTWAAIMLWLRNTLINWAVFSPLFAAVAGAPVFYFAFICLSGSWGAGPIARWAAFGGFGVASLVCIGITNLQICISLPTHWKVDDKGIGTGERGFGLSAQQIFRRISFCSLLWTFLAPLAVAPLLAPAEPAGGIQATFWNMPSPTSKGAPALPPKIPRLATLVPDKLKPVMSEPILRERTALCILPTLLWVTYQLAFEIARLIVRRRYRKNLRDAPGKAVAARAAADDAALNDRDWAVLQARAAELEREAERAPALLRENMIAFTDNRLPWMVGGLIGALAICGGLRLDFGHSALWLALAGPLWITGAEILRSAAFVAVRKGGIYSDLDREWLARISGDKLRVAIAVSALAVCAVLLPRLVFDKFDSSYKTIGAVLAFFGSGSIGAFLGQSARTVFTHGVKAADDPFWTRGRLIKLFAGLFAVFLFMFAGRIVIIIACAIDHVHLVSPDQLKAGDTKDSIAAFGRLVLTLACIVAGFAVLAFGIDRGVNLNRFSMHAVYRNRIIRAFLGTARAWSVWRGMKADDLAAHQPERIPNRYTQMGPQDNMRLADAVRRHPARLFHVINTTLNRTTGGDTARAARKGEPFTITPLHCGSPSLNKWNGAYVRTTEYAGGDKETGVGDLVNGITLGTALAISGAAVSPNMGYNSSPFSAFLMTLFNVRLGAWLPNPASRAALKMPADKRRDFFSYPGPRSAIPTLLQEMTGQSHDGGRYVYLSDGGHFDNLGLYEMLRRRCAQIFVVDAGADDGYGYFDLGHTLEMASIDLGVQINFVPPLACTNPKLSLSAAYATIRYPPDELLGLPESSGHLIYLKPWLPDDAPIELLSYKKVKTKFPHEPTEDQFFTESDFESYRRLGEYLTNNMMIKLHPHPVLSSLFEQASLLSRLPATAPSQPKQPPQPLPKPKRRWFIF